MYRVKAFTIVKCPTAGSPQNPYAGWDNERTARDVARGYRLPCPTRCPAPLHTLMLQCWQQDPGKRPSFAELRRWITDMADIHGAHRPGEEGPHDNSANEVTGSTDPLYALPCPSRRGSVASAQSIQIEAAETDRRDSCVTARRESEYVPSILDVLYPPQLTLATLVFELPPLPTCLFAKLTIQIADTWCRYHVPDAIPKARLTLLGAEAGTLRGIPLDEGLRQS